MAGYASGKNALAISDRSGMRFPYSEMVREWNGSLVHYSEFEAKQPQLSPKPVGSDPIALFNPRPQRASVASLILLENNPFEIVVSAADNNTYVNVYSLDHQRKAGDIVRLRGAPEVISAGTGGSDAHNLQSFAPIPNIEGVTDIDSANGFTIQLGQINKTGNVTGNTTNDVLTNPISYFYFQSADNSTAGSGLKAGGPSCSAGPVTLEVVGGNS
tara:strand:- start:17 stop:661 length:645 start_codon:yes stop_codon:yes gene_type:complete